MVADLPSGPVLTPALLAAVRRYVPLLVLLPLALALLVLVEGRPGPASHVTTTSVYVTARADDDARNVNRGALYVQRQMTSWALLATSSDVLTPVIDDLGLTATPRGLAGRVGVGPVSGSVLQVSVRGGSTKESRALSTAVATSLADQIVARSPRAASGQASVSTTVLGSTSFARTASYPWPRAILAGALGLVAALAFVLFRYGTGQRLHDGDDVREITSAPVLGELGRSRPGSTANEQDVERLAYGVRTTAATAEVDTIVVADTVTGRAASDVADLLATALSFGASTCVAIHPRGDRAELSSLVAAARADHDLVLVVWPQHLATTDALPIAGVHLGLLAVVTRGRTSVPSLVTMLRAAEAREIDVLGVATIGTSSSRRTTAATAAT